MRHDEIAADLARKLEKAIPGDVMPLAHGMSHEVSVLRKRSGDSLGTYHTKSECELAVALRNAAPLLLSERAALRAVEDAARIVFARIVFGGMGPNRFIALGEALAALDRIREEA